MSFPKKGKVFPPSTGMPSGAISYATAIGQALRQELGGTNQAIKVLVRWTGANERTVKNWLTGRNGPSGEHLVALIRHSSIALNTVLYLADRKQAIVGEELAQTREMLVDMIKLIKTLNEG
jgi:chloramphenicol 3-O-phosphotransferase